MPPEFKPISFPIFNLDSGRNGSDNPHTLGLTAAVEMENLEFYQTTCLRRRRGLASLATVAGSDIAALEHDVAGNRLLAALDNGTLTVPGGAAIALPDAISADTARTFTTAGLNERTVLAYANMANRLHVLTGTTVTRHGMDRPAIPTVAAGTATSDDSARAYRIRWIQRDSAGAIVRQSRASTVARITPSSTTVVATRPTAVDATATHWRLEGALDVLPLRWRIIGEAAIADTTLEDVFRPRDAYAGLPFAPPAGVVDVAPSARYLTANLGRIFMAGNYSGENEDRVWWTGGAAGEDEIVEGYVDLDPGNGGGITGFGGEIFGNLVVFKRSQIWQLTPTAVPSDPIGSQALTRRVGAVPGSMALAHHPNGRDAIYFCDPLDGPMAMLGVIARPIGHAVRDLWDRVNLGAQTPVHAVYDRPRDQVLFWLALDSADNPNALAVWHLGRSPSATDGGWTTSLDDGALRNARAAVAVPPLDTDTSTTPSPRIAVARQVVQFTDESDDDAGEDFAARWTSRFYRFGGNRPFDVEGLDFYVRPAAGIALAVFLHVDGVERAASDVIDFTPRAGEEGNVLLRSASVRATNAHVIQVEVVDLDPPRARAPWRIDYMTLHARGIDGSPNVSE